jgi:glycosyltransferase involved in cell wall biosynthesis
VKILTIAEDFFPAIGGIAAHVQGLSSALVTLGHDVRVVTRRRLAPGRNLTEWRGRQFVYDGVPVTAIPMMYSPRNLLERFQLGARFGGVAARTARRMAADVVTFHHYLYDPEIVRRTRAIAPAVFTNHSSQFLAEMELGDEARRQLLGRFAFASAVIAPSRELVDATVACGYPSARVHYVPNGVDPVRFAPSSTAAAEVRHDLEIPRDDPIVLCARRPVPKNGVVYFGESLARLAAAGVRCTVLFAGLTPEPEVDELQYTTRFREAVRALPESITTRLLGNVANDAMPRLHAASDVAVLPSLLEATSIAGLETMSSGVPLVGTTVGGIPEIVESGVSGILVAPQDAAALASALEQVLRDAGARRAMGARARERVLRQFSWEAVARQSTTVYAEAAAVFKSNRQQRGARVRGDADLAS